MQQIERGLTEEKEASAQALAKEVARATLAEIQGMLDRDMDILKKKLPGKPEQAVESALDMKYMRERQLSFSCMKLFQVVGTFFCYFAASYFGSPFQRWKGKGDSMQRSL